MKNKLNSLYTFSFFLFTWRRSRHLLFPLYFILFTSPVQTGKITVHSAWFRPGAAGMNSALYLEITNNQNVSDTLYGVKSAMAKITEMHETYKSGDMMGMRHTKLIAVGPHSTLKFQPGGHHIMLIGLLRQFREGASGQIKLYFKKAGEVKVSAVVRK